MLLLELGFKIEIRRYQAGFGLVPLLRQSTHIAPAHFERDLPQPALLPLEQLYAVFERHTIWRREFGY